MDLNIIKQKRRFRHVRGRLYTHTANTACGFSKKEPPQAKEGAWEETVLVI